MGNRKIINANAQRFRQYILLLLLVILSCLPQSCAQKSGMPPLAVTPPPSQDKIVISAVGDVMMHRSIQKAIAKNKNNYDLLFSKVSPYLGAADITFANLETPVDHKSAASGYPRFNAKPALLTSLKKAGVDVVSVANNHVMDKGVKGLERTLENIAKAGIVYTGAGSTKKKAAEIPYLEAGGFRVAFLGYTYTSNRKLPPKKASAPGVNLLRMKSKRDLSRAVKHVKEARKTADLVVVSLHWGVEYKKNPTTWQKKAAVELVEAGADIILGHHPHVLQPVVRHTAKDGRQGVIAYSLGNFISSQNYGVSYKNRKHSRADRGDGIILTIGVVKKEGKVSLSSVAYLPLWSHREKIGKAPLYRPLVLEQEIARLKSMPKRSAEQESALKLFAYRLKVINGRFSPKTKK
ncbi:MAG TPA: hypothetical protein DCO77_04135 [Nitrospiraceae bacterium]|nr:hypothetical protein [Nitrospiraceae bacterium]